jgi:hypothetical protein
MYSLMGSLLTIVIGLTVVPGAPLSDAPGRLDQHGTRRPFTDRL